MKPKFNSGLLLGLAALTLALTVPSSFAATYYWDPQGGGAFGVIDGTVTWASPLSLIWTNSDTGNTTRLSGITTGTGDTVNFGSNSVQASGINGIITTSGTGAVVIDADGETAGNVIFGALASAVTINGGTLTLGAASTITVNNASDTIASVIAGAATSLTKAGTGSLTLSNANTYAGNTNINAGILLWSGTNDVNGGTLQVNAGGNFSLADGTALTTTTTSKLGLATGANLSFDWNAGSLDMLTSTAAATTAGNVGIIIKNTSPTGSGGTLISSPSGGLTTAGSTNYFLANNTNFTATLTVTDTDVSIGAQSAATALTNAYWLGGQVTSALATMALSSDTTSNWGSDATGTLAGGIVPGSAANVIFGATGATQPSVTGGANMTVKSITFNDTAAITIAGSNLITLTSTSGTAAATTAALATVTAGSAISVTSFASATNTISAGLRLNANQTWNVASGKTLTVSGRVESTNSISAGLIKADAGTLVLSGTNTYTGPTAVIGGTLIAGAAVPANGNGALGRSYIEIPVGVASGNNDATILTGGAFAVARAIRIPTANASDAGTRVLTVGGNTAASSTFSGAVYLGTTNQTSKGINLTAVSGGTTTFSGVIQNPTGQDVTETAAAAALTAVTKTGPGTVVLSGPNTYTGSTSIEGGILSVTNASGLGTGSVSINGGVRLSVNGGLTVSNDITLGTNAGVAGRGLLEAATAGTTTMSGAITINNNAAAGGHFYAAASAVLSLTGPITSSVPLTARIGTIMLSGGGTGYTALTVAQNTTMVGADNGIATTAAVTIGSSGAGNLDLNGFNQSLAGITKGANAAIIGNSSTTADSTLTTTGTSTFDGVIQDVISPGTRKVNVSVNSGALTLGGLNTFTGDVTVSGGTLIANATETSSAAALGAANNTRTITVSSGATLQLAQAKALKALFSSSNAPSLIINGTVNDTNLSNPGNNPLGNVTLNSGTLSASVGNGSGYGSYNLNGTVTSTGTSFISSSAIVPITLSAAAGTTTTFDVQSGALAVSAALGQVTATGDERTSILTKTGDGTLILSGANDYTGATNVNNGTLALVGGSQTSPITVASGASLGFTLGSPTTSTSTFDLSAGTIKITGTPTLASYTLITSSAGITGTPTLDIPISGYTLQVSGNSLNLVQSGTPYSIWASSKGLNDSDAAHSSAKDADPDGDRRNNLSEFAFDGNPLSGASDGKIVTKIATISSSQVLTLTLPVRGTAPTPTFSDSSGDQLSALIDGIYYRIEGSADLVNFAETITEVTGGDASTIQTGLPGLSSGWSYRTFRISGSVSSASKDFMRAKISETP